MGSSVRSTTSRPRRNALNTVRTRQEVRGVLKTPGGAMQRMTSWARLRDMISHRRIRGLAAAGLLCAALAGWGAAAEAATSLPAPGGAALATAHAVGCASVNQATSATVTRYVTTEPVNGGKRTYTQRHAAKVRALFRDFCAALAHAGRPEPGLQCAFEFGNSYRGT